MDNSLNPEPCRLTIHFGPSE